MTHEDLRAQRAMQNKSHQREFKGWVVKKNVKVHENPSDAGLDTVLRVGDLVTYTNENGVVFEEHTVLGFRKVVSGDILPDWVVYIDVDCYWSPVRLSELTKE